MSVLVQYNTDIPSGLCIILMLGCDLPLSFDVNMSNIQKKGGKRTRTEDRQTG